MAVVGFLYVPWAKVMATEDLSRNHTLCKIYALLNWIDRQFFGGRAPIGDITFRLSSNRPHATRTVVYRHGALGTAMFRYAEA